MRIFVITDTHFGHRSLVEEHLSRPLNFEQKIIHHWQRMVTDNDIVIHLGDVLVGKSTDWFSIIPKLSGRKVLVMGNHDEKTSNWYMTNGIDFCCQQFVLDMYGLRILFSHEPIFDGNFDLNIHGHLHLGQHREYKCDERHYLLALEKNGYQIQLLESIIKDWKKGNRCTKKSEKNIELL